MMVAYWNGEKRIIPADAGSTTMSPRVTSLGWDHPRRCGEHLVADEQPIQLPGSSPQMRGARWPPDRMAGCLGIIPADAGSTYS